VPKITALSSQKNDSSRVSLYLDGKFTLGLSKDLACRVKLAVGQELSTQKIGEIKNQDQEEKHLDSVYHYLSYRPRSEKEVVDYLGKKGTEPGAIGRIVFRLKKEGYLDDQEFARWWVDQRRRFRPRSRYFLKGELIKKGVGVEIINRVLENVDESSLIEKIILERKNRLADLEPSRAKEKLIAYLSRRGFSWENIKLGLEKTAPFLTKKT